MSLDKEINRRDFLRLGIAAGAAAVTAANPLLAGSTEAAAYTSPFGNSRILGVKSISAAETYRDPHVKEIIRNSLDIPPSQSDQRSEEMVLSPRQAWSTRLWWPLDTGRGLELGIPKIHDEWWSAHVYELLGGPGNIWQQSKEKADFILKNYPNAKSYAGYCPWVAIAQLVEQEPEALEGENFAGATDTRTIKWLKEGLLTTKHAGDILVPVPQTREVFIALMQMGVPAVVDLPAGLGMGNWFRSVQGISEDGKRIRVTNFGREDTDFPLSAIVSAWVAYPADSREEFAAGIKGATEFWRYKNVDRNFIDRQVSL